MDKKSYKDMWVYIEHDGTAVHPVALELCCEVRKLCDQSGDRLIAVIAGTLPEAEIERVRACGVDGVIQVSGTGYERYNTEAYTNLFTVLCQKYNPSAVFVGGTTNGRDFAPRFAARLETGCTSDATELIWIWDPVERYVFREDLSTVTVSGGSFFPAEGFQSSEPYFTRNGLEINAAAELGTFLLENGVCSYSGFGDGYNTGDCCWEITKNYDQTHDGIRELQFDAICYIPDSSIPYFDQQYMTVTDSELYDFYTGMWLTSATAYGNSQRGDNYYLHTVSWQGKSYLIEFAYSTAWQYDVGDWAQVLTKSYVVYLPEDYDGLIFAAEAQPDNYKDSAKRMQLSSIAPEADVLNIDTLDPYSSLYFSLCY